MLMGRPDVGPFTASGTVPKSVRFIDVFSLHDPPSILIECDTSRLCDLLVGAIASDDGERVSCF